MAIVALPIAPPFQTPVGALGNVHTLPPYSQPVRWYQGAGNPELFINIMPSSISGVAGAATLAALAAQGIVI